MTSAEVRQSFLDFFAARGHTIVPSASLVPTDDPSLLFTNAGMNQFKDVFLGVGTRQYSRAADAQKIMRVSGKHNDLDEVGRDETHHTFFEMLGNWSFGDYYKEEAIAWAWELLTEEWGLPGERLWATVFRDERGELDTDDEAASLWRSETDIMASHVLYFGREDNFWEMADTGPCGPNSEIHFDMGAEACELHDDPDHVCSVNGDCARFLELWNLVFIQYNRLPDGSLEPLPARHIDTGLGFERIVSLLQGVRSNYDTDLFTPIFARIRALLNHSQDQMAQASVAYRVIADHSRALTFLVGDGVLPGNEGRNYVLRMILRRAARFGRSIGFSQPFLAEIAEVVIETMGDHYPEIRTRRPFILTTITQEEQRFLRTLDAGLARLDEELAVLADDGAPVVPGNVAFRLYDTFGLPLQITEDVASERGLTVDEAGFAEALAEQRERGRESGRFQAVDGDALALYGAVLASLRETGVIAGDGVEYDPYGTTEMLTSVVALVCDGERVQTARDGQHVEVVLAATPFYVESGGQVADAGLIELIPEGAAEAAWSIAVSTAFEPVPGLVVHRGMVRSGEPRVDDNAWAIVDYERRLAIARNHTATHLLHSELRYILGEQVQQAGSYVGPDRLRFDFTHSAMLTQDELDSVSRSVNDAILLDYPVEVHEARYRQALEEGVIALFGEKYGDDVRVLSIGWPDEPFSRELCGGTHVLSTCEIGLFYITSEQSIGAGVRRIEAVTGRAAVDLALDQLGVLGRAGAYLGVPPVEVDRKVLTLLDELQVARREVDRLQEVTARQQFEALIGQTRSVADVRLLSARVSAPSADVLRQMTDWARDRLGSGVVVLGTVVGGRPLLVAAVTPDLVERGANAATLVRGMAKLVKGGGGGRATLAQAGGRDPARLDDALRAADRLLADMLGRS
jgi:alanyl-tRNA synthetase